MADPIGTRRGTRKADGTRAGGGGGAFNPTSLITGAGGFWRADMGVTLSGSNVTQWNDQSSFANNLTNNGIASNVTFSATGFNTSFPAVTLADNSNGTMRAAAAFAAGATVSMFFLASPVSTSGARWGWLDCTGLNSGQDFTTPSFICFGTTQNFSVYSNGQIGNAGNPVATPNGTPVLIGCVFDGANCNIWVNGAVVGSGSAFTSNLGAASAVKFGLGNSLDLNGSNGSAMGEHYAFWGITQKAMNTTDWGNLKTYCNSNWGTAF